VNEDSTPVSLVTRFAELTPRQARVILAVVVTTVAAFLLASFHDAKSVQPGGVQPEVPKAAGEGDAPDLVLYRAIVQRVHDGESYYTAAQAELRGRGYATRSVFNWRPPTYAWVLGALPNPTWAQGILCICAFLAAMLSFFIVARAHGMLLAAFTMALLVGPLYWCLVDNAFYSQEVWAGTLIVLSLCCYGVDLGVVGAVVGLAALFFRELALPYCVIMAAIAVWQRRKLETALWIVGFIAFAIFLFWHAHQVTGRLTADDERIAGESWLRLGGLRFVLLTAHMDRYYFSAPAWLLALYLPLALLGLAAWRSVLGLRMALTAAAYVLAFCIAGNPRINDYWGLLYVGLLPFGIVWAPLALRDLIRAALGSSAKMIAP
jgi:hypothetical protein